MVFLVGWKSVPPDKIMLHYTGGPIQGQHFKEVVPPGTHTKLYGVLENYYLLPATQRTYTFSRDPNAGDKAGTDYISGAGDPCRGTGAHRPAARRHPGPGRAGLTHPQEAISTSSRPRQCLPVGRDG